jgi:hypothetical protein
VLHSEVRACPTTIHRKRTPGASRGLIASSRRWPCPLHAVLALLVVLLAAGMLPAMARADTITAAFPSFDSANVQAFNLNGSATLNGSVLQLTPSQLDVAGSAWWKNKVFLGGDRSFSAYFTFRLHPPITGAGAADGIVFVVQPMSSSAYTGGYGIGYLNINPSVGIEFDTWRNPEFGDPAKPHIGVDLNGSVVSVAQAMPAFDFSDAQLYHAWVDYDGVSDTIEVRLNDSIARPAAPVISYHVDLALAIDQQVYLGFTSATGGGAEVHDIGGIYFNNAYTPLDPENVSYDSAPVTTLEVHADVDSMDAGEATQVTATATDLDGNPVAGETVSFMSSDGAIDPTAVTDASGRATAVYQSSGAVCRATVSATVGGGAYGKDIILVGAVPPTTTATGLAADDHSGWQSWGTDPVTFAVQPGVAPVAATYYVIDDGFTDVYFMPIWMWMDGSHKVRYWSVDVLGNAEDPKVGYINTDSWAPAVTATGLDDWGTWHTQPQQVTISADDGAGSGVDRIEYRGDGGPWQTYTEPFTLSADGDHSIEYRAYDKAGNGTWDWGEVRIDTTPPTTVASGLTDETTWTWDRIDFWADDGWDGSGVKVTHYSVDGGPWLTTSWSPSIAEGRHTLEYYSEDWAGNCEQVHTGLYNLDANPPVLTASGLTSGWVSGPHTVTLTADDGLGSGIDRITYILDGRFHVVYDTTVSIVLGDGSHSLDCWCDDNMYGTSEPLSGDLRVESVAPVTTATGLDPSAGMWTGHTHAVVLGASDGGGSGVQAIYYTLDGGPQQTYAGGFDVAGDGPHVVTYWAVDVAGNVEAAHTGYASIDADAPVTTATGVSASDTQWTTGADAITLTPDDGEGSGVAATYYSVDGGPQELYAGPFSPPEGPHTVEYHSVDVAGNVEVSHTAYANIDVTAPTTAGNGLTDAATWTAGSPLVWLLGDDGSGVGLAHTYYSVNEGPWTEALGAFFVADEGAHLFKYYSVDLVGNREDVKTGYANVDTAGPMTTVDDFDLSGTAWLSSDQAISFTAADGAGSGVDKTYYSVDGDAPAIAMGNLFLVSGEGTHTLSYWSVDKIGNVEDEHSGTVNIDTVAPTATAAGLDPSAGSWTSGTRTVILGAGDGSGSGVKAIYYTLDGGPRQTYAGEFDVAGDGAHVVTYWAVDYAGNVEDAHTGCADIDANAPVTMAAGLSPDWVDGAQTVTLAAGDGSGSGIAAVYYTLDGSQPQLYGGAFDVSAEGQHSVTYWSKDNAGHLEDARSGWVKIDETAPKTSAAGLDGSAVNHAQTVTLTASDASGSGIASTHYTLDGGDPVTYDGPFSIATEGLHSVAYWSIDKAGNTEQQAGLGSITIDTTAPVTTASGVQADDHSGAVAYQQTVTLAATDVSPVAATYYTLDGGPRQTYAGPFTVKGTGAHAVTYWSVDVLDNAEAAHPGFVNIAAPGAIVTTATGLSGDDHSGWTNDARTVTLTATGGWGELTTYYTIDGGARQTYTAPFQISAEGSHLVAYGSVDQRPGTMAWDAGYANLDLTPPATTTTAPPTWRNTTVVLSALATDSGSGVADTFYRIDGGALQTSAMITVPALPDHSMDGTHTIAFYSADKAGNVEVAKTQQVRIDTTKPRLQLKKTLFTWRHNRTATVKYRVTDATVTEVDVQLRVTQFGTPKTRILKLGLKRCGAWYVGRFKCTLPAHHYNLHMLATDYAGNLAGRSGLIIVRK